MDMPGRSVGQDYKFSFNGKLDDSEDGWQTQDYGYRTYDYRIGRFYSEDPLMTSYPFYTPYQFAGNRPITSIDIEGMEPKEMITSQGKLTKPIMAIMEALYDYNMAGMEKTTWVKTDKVNPSNSSAMTMFQIVLYKKGVEADDNYLEWFRLISHEHEHRNEIENSPLGPYFWYLKYGLGWFEYCDYYKNQYEKNAYKNGAAYDGNDIAKKVFDKYGEEIKKILFDKTLNESEKENEMRIIGYKFNLEEAENKYDELSDKYSSLYWNKGGAQMSHFKAKITEYKDKIEMLELNRSILKSMRQSTLKINNNSENKGTEQKKSSEQRSMY